ncbi:MAG: J domain-containing protein [Treponema sp.]|jgi:hypothetical protein|nr:J domain-containing protein [Treponema sp.]
MGFFSRLGSVINSYLNGMDDDFGRAFRSADPDLNDAYEELNDFLNRKEPRPSGASRPASGGQRPGEEARSRVNLPPEDLRPDFDCLGVPFGAGAGECKAAYKKLLKIHHPDRHAGHEGNFKKATEKSAKINAAYDRIEKWRNGGRAG